jgi:hypothetical protein
MRHPTILLLALVILAACRPAQTIPPPDTTTVVPTDTPALCIEPTKCKATAQASEADQPYAPQPGDDALQRGNAYINSVDILTMESYPLQFAVVLKGELPTPCHELRIIYNPPDAENKIQIEVFSVADPNAVCAQMLQPFEQNIPLGSFPAGHYTLWVNGNQMGEFDA